MEEEEEEEEEGEVCPLCFVISLANNFSEDRSVEKDTSNWKKEFFFSFCSPLLISANRRRMTMAPYYSSRHVHIV